MYRLLDASRQVVLAEARHLEADQAGDRAHFEAMRRQLEQAYDADLREQATPTAQWVREATTVYVAAREALMRAELQQAADREARAELLRDAALAQQRAWELLELQQGIVEAMVPVNLWNLLNPSTPPAPGAQR